MSFSSNDFNSPSIEYLVEATLKSRENFENYKGKSILVRTFITNEDIQTQALYQTGISCNGLIIYNRPQKLQKYRSINEKLQKKGIDKNFLGGKFPPGYSKLKFGIKLTPRQLIRRQFLLDVWVRRLFLKYSQFPNDISEIFRSFFNIDTKIHKIIVNK